MASVINKVSSRLIDIINNVMTLLCFQWIWIWIYPDKQLNYHSVSWRNDIDMTSKWAKGKFSYKFFFYFVWWTIRVILLRRLHHKIFDGLVRNGATKIVKKEKVDIMSEAYIKHILFTVTFFIFSLHLYFVGFILEFQPQLSL